MTSADDSRDEPTPGTPDGNDLPLDEDAAWRAIVENYGSRPELGPSAEPTPPVAPPPDPAPPARSSLFDRTYLDAQAAENDRAEASWSDEGHFVPPEPPPLPAADTTAKFAWLGVLGGPALLLLAVLLGWDMTWWLTTLGIGGFLGGFATLVSRMKDDDEDLDDPGRGAVV